jgi:hypothetical protein
MLTPLAQTQRMGTTAQNAMSQCHRSNVLQIGAKQNITGQAIQQARRMPPVPIFLCKGGNTNRSHNACEVPVKPRNTEIWKGEKPKPPNSGLVNQKTGITERVL